MIHVAGPMIDQMQRCTRCDAVLTDYRFAMVPADSGPLFGWEEGSSVEITEGNPRMSMVVDDPPDCEKVQ